MRNFAIFFVAMFFNKIMAIIKLIIAEIRNGICEPNLSHRIPVKKEPSMIEKLESIVSNPIAEPRCSLGIKSEIHALETPSVDAA